MGVLNTYHITTSTLVGSVDFLKNLNNDFGKAVKKQPIQMVATDIALLALAWMVMSYTFIGIPIGLTLCGFLLTGSFVLTFELACQWKELHGTIFSKGEKAFKTLDEKVTTLGTVAETALNLNKEVNEHRQ